MKKNQRFLAVLLAIIFICAIAAHIVTTDGAKIKVERITIDSRGATMDGELFYPHGTTDKDKLPAVIVTHGAGVNGGNMKNFATELARRGFVVLNITAYGAGISEFPANDEIGTGAENYNARATPGGLLDTVNFVRTLNFVDQTRIGIMGHSQGSRRISYASALDCGYLTFNDIMINVLYDTFGQKFTGADILKDADDLAAERLNEDQLAFYEILKAQEKEKFDTRVFAALVVGGDASLISPLQTVSVGGIEVQRNCQTNLGLIIGTFDSYIGYPSAETTLASYYTDTPLALDTWYSIDDRGQSSTTLGNFFESEVTKDDALKTARDARTLRFVTMPVETHSRNMLSIASTRAAVKFFEQMLSYNNGEIESGSARIPYTSMVFLWREIFSLIAMLAMLIALVPYAAILTGTPYFSACLADNSGMFSVKTDKKKYWIFNVVIAIVGYIAIFKTNSIFAPGLPYWKILPLTFNWWMAFLYLLWMAGAAIVLLIVFYFIDKKNNNVQLKALNVGMQFKKILRTLLLAAILVVSAYILMSVLVYLFDEDFKFWTVEFTEVKVEFWWIICKYTILFLPELLLVGMLTNYTIRKDMPAWKEDLICVVCGSIGAYVCWLINYIVLHNGGAAICNWNSSYGMLILIPVTTYLARKMYRLSGSVWLGAFTNAMLISWTMACINGYNTYFPQSVLSNFFNL